MLISNIPIFQYSNIPIFQYSNIQFHTITQSRMKLTKLLLVLLLVGTAGSLFAQAKQWVLLEHFTNSNCSICASRNPAFFNLISNYEADVHHLAIHPSVPYPSCVFHQGNPADNDARKDYYGVFGTPNMYMLGVKVSSGSTLLAESDLQAQLGQTSPMQILVEETSGTNRDVTVTVNSLGAPPSGNLRLFVAVVEKEINQTTGNGEDVHHNVLRDFLTANTGDAFTPPASGNGTTFSFSYSIDNDWNADEIYVLAFVQNWDSKEVINSGSSLDPAVTSTANPMESSADLQLFPNPAGETVQVQTEGVHFGTDLILFNSLGQQVLSEKVLSSSNRLDLSGMEKGWYIVQVETDKGVIRKKLLIQ
jgi:hypothetical protein